MTFVVHTLDILSSAVAETSLLLKLTKFPPGYQISGTVGNVKRKKKSQRDFLKIDHVTVVGKRQRE